MTDRTTPHGTPAPGADGRDALRALYEEGVEGEEVDGGPSQEARDRILAYAREKAVQRASGAAAAPPAARQGAEAANDRHWLRHALGSLAVIGLVGWLVMQQFDQPPAELQMETSEPAATYPSSPAPANAEQAAPAPVVPAPDHAPARASVAPSEAPAAADREERSSSVPGDLSPRSAERSAAQAKRMQEAARPEANAAAAGLPDCDPGMGAAALAEQARRIEAQGDAPQLPAPVCRPVPMDGASRPAGR